MPEETPETEFSFLPLYDMPIWTELAAEMYPDYDEFQLGNVRGRPYVVALYGGGAAPIDPTTSGLNLGSDLLSSGDTTTNVEKIFRWDLTIMNVPAYDATVYGAVNVAFQPFHERLGDLGTKNSDQRRRWWKYLQEMNVLLDRARKIDIDWGHGWTPRKESRLGTSNDDKNIFMNALRPLGRLFKFKSNPASTNRIKRTPMKIITKTVALFNLMFVGDSSMFAGQLDELTDSPIHPDPYRQAFRDNWVTANVDQRAARALIRMIHRGLDVLEREIERQEDAARDAALAELNEEAAMLGADQEGFALEPLGPEELELITGKSEYQKYFSTTFSKEIITFVPIMQNFFLTGKYFQNINESFYASNALALEILISTIRNDDNYKNKPDLRRLPPSLAGTVDDQLDKHSASARDFILKMLIMTPINILKGLCELIDPHVGLTKIIKNVTGYAFDELAEVLNVPAEGINVARKEAAAALADVDPATIEIQGINGDDLLKFILCILQMAMEESLYSAPLPEGMPEIPANFLPDIERDGINFTGKISGLLMMPPTPLGLIYLLLGLIKFGEDEVVDALQPPDPEVCLDEETPSVTEEATEDLCEPDKIP